MNTKSPLIGILGGMGPQAGLDMADKLIAMTRTARDQDHVPFILFSLPGTVPDRTDFLLGKTSTNPAFAIADQFEKMSGLGVSIAVMACNTAHASAIYDVAMDELQKRGVTLRILHLIDETILHIRRKYPRIRRIGILGTKGTYRSRLYDQALENAGLEVVLPDPEVRERDIHAALYDPAFGIKTNAGQVLEQAVLRVLAAARHLVKRGAGAIVLGCTELPLALKDTQVDGIPVLDPARIMAEKLILETYPDRYVNSG